MIITPIWLEKRGKQYRLAHKKEGQQVKRERCSFDEAIQTFKNVEAGAWSSKVYLEQIKAKRMINSICINTSLNKCKESFEASRKVGKSTFLEKNLANWLNEIGQSLFDLEKIVENVLQLEKKPSYVDPVSIEMNYGTSKTSNAVNKLALKTKVCEVYKSTFDQIEACNLSAIQLQKLFDRVCEEKAKNAEKLLNLGLRHVNTEEQALKDARCARVSHDEKIALYFKEKISNNKDHDITSYLDVMQNPADSDIKDLLLRRQLLSKTEKDAELRLSIAETVAKFLSELNGLLYSAISTSKDAVQISFERGRAHRRRVYLGAGKEFSDAILVLGESIIDFVLLQAERKNYAEEKLAQLKEDMKRLQRLYLKSEVQSEFKDTQRRISECEKILETSGNSIESMISSQTTLWRSFLKAGGSENTNSNKRLGVNIVPEDVLNSIEKTFKKVELALKEMQDSKLLAFLSQFRIVSIQANEISKPGTKRKLGNLDINYRNAKKLRGKDSSVTKSAGEKAKKGGNKKVEDKTNSANKTIMTFSKKNSSYCIVS